MNWIMRIVMTALSIAILGAPPSSTQEKTWKFAVSGDSRNCGDVVMPAIAAGVEQAGAEFYWHLGDFRRISETDEDTRNQPEHLAKPLTESEYQAMAWGDFTENQVAAFGRVPFYVGVGNHEMIPPKNRAAFLREFAGHLDLPEPYAQRLADDPADMDPKTYYHWIHNGVDFINLDNSINGEFDAEQLAWFEKTLKRDSDNPKIRAFVVGMHEALPESISKGHSMNESLGGTESGLRAYVDLLKVQKRNHKRVYVLASHSHYFMDGIFNTAYWRTHGGILPGWIIGTAGAVRYPLPPDSKRARAAKTNVYGFLIGTADKKGRIRFEFRQLSESDVPAAVTSRYTPQFVHWCFAENSVAH